MAQLEEMVDSSALGALVDLTAASDALEEEWNPSRPIESWRRVKLEAGHDIVEL